MSENDPPEIAELRRLIEPVLSRQIAAHITPLKQSVERLTSAAQATQQSAERQSQRIEAQTQTLGSQIRAALTRRSRSEWLGLAAAVAIGVAIGAAAQWWNMSREPPPLSAAQRQAMIAGYTVEGVFRDLPPEERARLAGWMNVAAQKHPPPALPR